MANAQRDSENAKRTGRPFSGEVEVDESHMGNRTGKPTIGDAAPPGPQFFGVVERQGRIATQVVPDTTVKTLTSEVHEQVTPVGTVVYSDEHPATFG